MQIWEVIDRVEAPFLISEGNIQESMKLDSKNHKKSSILGKEPSSMIPERKLNHLSSWEQS